MVSPHVTRWGREGSMAAGCDATMQRDRAAPESLEQKAVHTATDRLRRKTTDFNDRFLNSSLNIQTGTIFFFAGEVCSFKSVSE